MSLFSIRRECHIVLDFLSLCLSIPLGQTHTKGLVCFWRARNPITFETTSVAPNDSPAGCLIALTTATDTEAASHSTVCVVETFPLGLETVFLYYLMQFLSCIYGFFQSTDIQKVTVHRAEIGTYPMCTVYRRIQRVIYVLRSQAPLSLRRWQRGTEHIYTDNRSKDVWVNHGRNRPLQQIKIT